MHLRILLLHQRLNLALSFSRSWYVEVCADENVLTDSLTCILLIYSTMAQHLALQLCSKANFHLCICNDAPERKDELGFVGIPEDHETKQHGDVCF